MEWVKPLNYSILRIGEIYKSTLKEVAFNFLHQFYCPIWITRDQDDQKKRY